jgi:hypothetical protein
MTQLTAAMANAINGWLFRKAPQAIFSFVEVWVGWMIVEEHCEAYCTGCGRMEETVTYRWERLW